MSCFNKKKRGASHIIFLQQVTHSMRCQWRGANQLWIDPQQANDQNRLSAFPQRTWYQAVFVWKRSGKCQHFRTRVQIEHSKITFITPGGYSGPSLSSSTSLSHSPLAFFLLFFALPFAAGTAATLHTLQSGTLWLRMSASISLPGTFRRHCRQLAVANEPWHWRTFLTPARFSRVSMFWV